MTSFLNKGLGAFGIAALISLSVACGSTTPAATGDSGTKGDSGGATTDSGPATEAGPTSGGDAGDAGADVASEAGAGINSFGTAAGLVINDPPTNGTLVDAKTKDYYKFTATAGQRLLLATAAQSLVSTTKSNGDDNTVIDTVVTVYDSTKTPIAQDDDDWPRTGRDSALFFEVPANGDYYVSVEDCNSAFGSANCSDPTTLATFDYTVTLVEVKKLVSPEINAASTQDGTTAKAQSLNLKVPSGSKAGQYGFNTVDGNFTASSSTHVYSFTVPSDVAVTAGERTHAYFWPQPIGASNGDGSTSNVKVWVTDSTGTTILEQADQSNFKDGDNQTDGPLALSVPVVKGSQYYLFVQAAATPSKPATDYYFIEAFVGSYYYGTLELEGATATGVNDTLATAQKLASPSGVSGAFFADGNLATPSDVDWYEVDAPGTAKQVFFSCEAQRRGSGVNGFSAVLYDGTGSLAIATLGPEVTPAVIDLTKNVKTLPTGLTKAFVKVSATGQSATVTGTNYSCSVSYQ